MDDDVIGSEPARAPRPRRSWRVPLPAGVGRHGRLAAIVAVLVVVAGVVVVSRAGVTGLQPSVPPTPSPTSPPLTGDVLYLAAGRNTVYAVASDCLRNCRPTLVASHNDGFRWTELRLPGAAVTAPVVRPWTLSVSGVEDLLAIEDPAAGVVTVGNTSTPFQARKIVPGAPVVRVPTDRESMTRVCAKPRCRTPTLEYLEPRTGVRSPLATQPPFPPQVLGAGGAQLWVAGIDPRTRHYAVAVSFDDGATWSRVPLPKASTDAALVPRLVPVPEQNQAYFLQGYPDGPGVQTSYGIWLVPAPSPGGTAVPRQVRPDQPISAVDGAVGLEDGRLALTGAGDGDATGSSSVVLSPDGTVDRALTPDVNSPRYVLRSPLRGPHQLIAAEAVRLDGAASIAVSATGNPTDWDIRPIRL